MKQTWSVLVSLLFQLGSSVSHAATPLVEFTSVANATQLIKPGNSGLIFYTLRNNTAIGFPLSYTLSSPYARVDIASSTCAQFIAAKSSCGLAVEYNATNNNKSDPVTLLVNYQGRAPLSHTVTFNVDGSIACSLINSDSYQTPFCQQQYQQIIQQTANVFNTNNANVVQDQTLGGMFGVFRKTNAVEEICYVSCGLRKLNGIAPNQNTIFELASVSKTFTTAILGKLLYNGTISAATNPIASSLPAGFNLGNNESSVSFQQLATFSGGVCFSDAPSVIQSNLNEVVNQNNFVSDINNLNPDPASGACSNGQSNTRPEYSPSQFLPSHNFYSNSSVGLLGQGLMNIAGFNVYETGFNNWMCENITNVLDMTQTNGCLPTAAINGNCGINASSCNSINWTASQYATGYHITQTNQYQSGDPFPFLPWAPAGGIRSNAADMVKFIRANLGFSTNASPLQSELIQGMNIAHQPNNYLPFPGSPRLNIGSQRPLLGGQGFAWVCENSPTNGDTLCGKIGGHTNFRSFVGLNKNQHYGLVILFNTGANLTNGSLTLANLPPSISQIGANLLENIN